MKKDIAKEWIKAFNKRVFKRKNFDLENRVTIYRKPSYVWKKK